MFILVEVDNMIFFDNNSTTILLPEVKQALHAAIDTDFGNPESVDNLGSAAREYLEQSRSEVAKLISSKPGEIVFTSSGSESNTIAIYTSLKRSKKKVIVASEIEHTSIMRHLELMEHEGFTVKYIQTLPSGLIDLEHAESLINKEVALVCVQFVNNETGVIQPVKTIAKLAHNADAEFLCDGSQAAGKLEVDVHSIGCDFFSFTAHKFHGPKGVGALWTRFNMEQVFPVIIGGSQEYKRRGGTHNLLGIIGMGKAAQIRAHRIFEVSSHSEKLRNLFEEQLLSISNDIHINGKRAPRVQNTTNVYFGGIDGKALFYNLIQKNIICSQTSACTSQYPEPSKVLRAMGLTYEQAFNSIRFSFSELNSVEEVLEAGEVISTNFHSIKNTLGTGW